jgi:septal ring factor EnvC (AmiA/AmiB activator)
MTTGIIIIAMVIVISVWAVIWYLYDEYKTYQDKYEWKNSQYEKARYEFSRLEDELKELQKPSKQTITINVDTDEVVSKVMAKVNKDIEALKKQEEVFIKIDGKEININELTKAMKKVGSNLK